MKCVYTQACTCTCTHTHTHTHTHFSFFYLIQNWMPVLQNRGHH